MSKSKTNSVNHIDQEFVELMLNNLASGLLPKTKKHTDPNAVYDHLLVSQAGLGDEYQVVGEEGSDDGWNSYTYDAAAHEAILSKEEEFLINTLRRLTAEEKGRANCE